MAHALKSPAVEALLERLGSSRLVEDGRLAIVSVEAIRARTGARWTGKQETVWGFAEREFRKLAGRADQIVRLDDVHYVLIQPDETPERAKIRSVVFVRDLLAFFLGSGELEDIRAGLVTSLSPEGLRHRMLAQAEVAETLDRHAKTMEAEDPEPPKTRPRPEPEEGPPRLMFMTQPVWSVRHRTVASGRLQAIDIGAPREFDAGDPPTRGVIELDLLVLDEAIRILERNGDARFGLHVPIQLRTLNSIPGRQAVLAKLRAAVLPTHEALVFCIQGLDAGVPRMVLETIVSALKPVSRGVLGRAPALATDVSAWKGARLSGVCFDFNDITDADEAESPQALARFAAAAGPVGPVIVGQSVTTRARLITAWAAGFTHLSGDLLERPDSLPFTPMRLEPAALFARPLSAA